MALVQTGSYPQHHLGSGQASPAGLTAPARAMAPSPEVPVNEETLYVIAQRIFNGATNLAGSAHDLRMKFDDRQPPAVVGDNCKQVAVERRPTVLEILGAAEQALLALGSDLKRLENSVGNW